MWGLIVSIALGGMLLMVAITALRDGELSVGETTFERGQPLFAVVVALLFAAGAGLGGYAAVVGWRTQQGEPRQVDGERFVMTLPASWKQDDDMATMLSRGGSMQALAYTGQGDELVVSWPTDPQPGATGVDQLVTQLHRLSKVAGRAYRPSCRRRHGVSVAAGRRGRARGGTAARRGVVHGDGHVQSSG